MPLYHISQVYQDCRHEDDDLEDIATETNRYAEQYFENNQNLGTFSRLRKWQNTCASEIKRYIALILAMGIISQSDINEYWSTDPVTSTPLFPATMSRDRFLCLCKRSFDQTYQPHPCTYYNL
jgi:hypothetical protein